MLQECLQIQFRSPGLNPVLHGSKLYHVIFQSKSQILSHTEADKLAVCILQDRADQVGLVIDTSSKSFLSLNQELTAGLPFIDMGDNAIQTLTQSGLARTGRPDNQDFLPFINSQIDLFQSRLGLSLILKRKVFKLNDCFFHFIFLYRQSDLNR
ncbi:hypothetical protein STRDD11_00761 [Streptococcus sp. DD11]|nr:hypothetical protein STRDD11_00761 [Streptococcus sp. DD11]